MARKKTTEQSQSEPAGKRVRDQGQRSGRPNPGNLAEDHTREHLSGYGGKAGVPRTSSDKREPGSPR